MIDKTTTAPVDGLATVLGATGDLVAAVRHDQWSSPTPCPEWTVRELVNHLVLGNRLFTGILRGEAAVPPGALDPKVRDALGDDPAATYRRAAAELLGAFRQPGVLERVFEVPVGPVPGIAAVHLRAVEELVHGWDLAQATGQQPRFPDDLVEQGLEFTRGKLADVPPDRSPFAPPRPVPGHASPLDRLAALLGRAIEPPR
ncbi:TIGR03086 family metal-binding protein [Amycolatopsis anabasis]|uniref:TIGR03086 family metal-binding protein n=1 Tax=Amycolatopsis anabasis TaxID=1840409 RepID=UPI00131AC179|nr:TIGR03086 family metal-binding protein [Amycolatopsis anabasis]